MTLKLKKLKSVIQGVISRLIQKGLLEADKAAARRTSHDIRCDRGSEYGTLNRKSYRRPVGHVSYNLTEELLDTCLIILQKNCWTRVLK